MMTTLFDPATPSGPPTLLSTPYGGRVWRLESDLFVVEAAPNNVDPPRCATVVVDMQGVVHCACPAGRRRIGCVHVLAVGSLLDQAPR